MAHYRAYLLGRDHRILEAVDLDCANDAAAIASPKQLHDVHHVEVWQGKRLLGKFAHRSQVTAPSH
jgi:hypothetical protein